MKNALTTILCIIIIFATACNTTSTSTPTTPPMTEDCYPDRATTNTIKNVEGEIIILLTDQYFISVKNSSNNTRYSPCNLADEYKVEGLTITFSGMVKAIKPNERLAGTPFVITSCAKK